MTTEKISLDKTEQLLIAMALTRFAEYLTKDGPSKDNKKMVKSICDLLDRMGYYDRSNDAWRNLMDADMDSRWNKI